MKDGDRQMNTMMLGLLAETPIHPGAGRSMGVVDLPVAREAATDYPVIVGSSLKGALKDKAGSANGFEVDTNFGKQDHAGDLIVSDARLLLLPVRSLTSSFRWATCPHLIERYKRDLLRAGLSPCPDVPSVDAGQVLAEGAELFLEERQFKTAAEPPKGIVDAVQPLLLHGDTRNSLGARLAVLNDADFVWFARYGLSVQARNVLESETKKSKNLWYEESLPTDTVMYALVVGRQPQALEALATLFPDDDPYLQVGGNETVGQGWFAVKRRSDQRSQS